jgi:histidine triad (HIT) family protein
MNTECIFCKIIAGQLPAKVVFQNPEFLVIEDRFPQAKTHFLVLPKQHFKDLTEADRETLGAMLATVQKVVEARKLMPAGFRIAINTGKGGGQTVFHLHTHILADTP